MKKNPNEGHSLCKITQNIFLVNDKKQVLFLKHKTGAWLLVGGRLNKDENWEQGLRREVEEETGIKEFSIDKIVEVDNWIQENISYYGTFFLGRIGAKEKVVLSEEHLEYRWVGSAKEAKSLGFWCPELEERVMKIFASFL